jgi:hypothetical protein
MDELFDPQSSPVIRVYSSLASLLGAFFFEAFFVAGFAAAASGSSFFAARFARGAAAAPPRLRPLLSASFAGFASVVSAGFAPFAAGRASLLSEIVT